MANLSWEGNKFICNVAEILELFEIYKLYYYTFSIPLVYFFFSNRARLLIILSYRCS